MFHTDPKRPGALLCALAMTVALPAAAQDWPSRPVRLMVGFAPGGGTDIIARMVAQPLAEILGQPIVVENKPGAGGTLAAGTVARAAPDGHTVFVMNNGHAVSAAIYRKLPFDSVKDFAPVSMLCAQPLVVAAGKNFPATDIAGLVKLARAQPGKLNYASVGIGSTQHFAGELLRQVSGIDIVHVPYKGTPNAVAAVLSGEVELLVDVASPLLGHIRAGELKPLAVTSPRRYEGLPQTPTALESGVAGYDVTTWYGLAFPAGTPAAIVDKMNQAVRRVLADENVRKQTVAAACMPEASTPQAMTSHVGAEIERWRTVMQKAGIEQQ